MSLFLKLLGREPKVPVNAGPLYGSVREAMKDVQAYARSHGGEIELVEVNDGGEVKIRFRGACAHCPMSALTLKQGVEERLQSLVPEVTRIVQV